MTDQELLSAFRHADDGSWVCVRPFRVNSPERNIAIVPGTTIARTDMLAGWHLARELDAAQSRLQH